MVLLLPQILGGGGNFNEHRFSFNFQYSYYPTLWTVLLQNVDVLTYMISLETVKSTFLQRHSFLYIKRFYHFVSRCRSVRPHDKFQQNISYSALDNARISLFCSGSFNEFRPQYLDVFLWILSAADPDSGVGQFENFSACCLRSIEYINHRNQSD